MTKGTNKVLNWFSGTHKQLMEALGISINNTEETEVATDYSSQTVSQLKTIAKERGLKGYSSLKKAELITLLSK
tara:strand:- start:142 stop:363 length:222 start_codon:yes stop_codon:yes gene_type:complete